MSYFSDSDTWYGIGRVTSIKNHAQIQFHVRPTFDETERLTSIEVKSMCPEWHDSQIKYAIFVPLGKPKTFKIQVTEE